MIFHGKYNTHMTTTIFQVLWWIERNACLPQILFWKRRHHWRCQGGLKERNYSVVSYLFFSLFLNKAPNFHVSNILFILQPSRFTQNFNSVGIEVELQVGNNYRKVLEKFIQILIVVSADLEVGLHHYQHPFHR